MPEFVYLFRGLESQKREVSPEEMQRIMEKWSAWARSFHDRQAMRGSSRLAQEGRIVDSNGVVSDGPFVESKEYVGGYFVVECADLAEAVEQAKNCPGLEYPGMTVEVRPVAT